jgi:hypothetical protein
MIPWMRATLPVRSTAQPPARGPHATAWAADDLRRGLAHQPPLAPRRLRGKDLEAVQAQQSGGRGITVLTHLGPPVLQTSHIRKICEVQVCSEASTSPSAAPWSTFHGEEPPKLLLSRAILPHDRPSSTRAGRAQTWTPAAVLRHPAGEASCRPLLIRYWETEGNRR